MFDSRAGPNVVSAYYQTDVSVLVLTLVIENVIFFDMTLIEIDQSLNFIFT